MDDGTWEKPAAAIANKWFWGKLQTRWRGAISSAALGTVIAVATHFLSSESWAWSALAGGLSVLTIWGIIYLFVWGVIAPRIQRNAAKQHIDDLERKPTGEIGEEVHREGSEWYVPVTNKGPRDAEFYAKVTLVTYQDGKDKHRKIDPISYIRWKGGTGDYSEGSPNWKEVKEAETVYLAVFGVTGSSTLPNSERGTEGKLLAANSNNNFPVLCPVGSELAMKIQVFGRPTLAEPAKQIIILEVPKYGGSQNPDVNGAGMYV